MKFKFSVLVLLVVVMSGCGGGGGTTSTGSSMQVQMQALGKKIFFDERLSSRENQSCGSCHDPASGFADPGPNVNSEAPVSEGSEADLFGERNAPTAAYAFFIPIFSANTDTTVDGTVSNYQGGQFLDGRRPNLMMQARDPFLNPVEMNMSEEDVVFKVRDGAYANDFIAVFGSGAFDNVTMAYNNIARAIAAFEASDEVNPFSSKFDDVMNGDATFSASEQRGFNLFKGTKAKCANCHTIPNNGPVLFTNHRYYNIGTPSNTNNPAVIADSSFVDTGVARNTAVISDGNALTEAGKFRTPTLRNIARTAPYMHNGVYDTLEDVIRHYDNLIADEFSIPEIDNAIANELTVALSLQPDESDDLIAFLKTLTDQ